MILELFWEVVGCRSATLLVASSLEDFSVFPRRFNKESSQSLMFTLLSRELKNLLVEDNMYEVIMKKQKLNTSIDVVNYGEKLILPALRVTALSASS